MEKINYQKDIANETGVKLISYNPDLAEYLDSIPAALLLNQLLYWWSITKAQEFYKTDRELYNEIRIKSKTLSRARQLLEKKGWIKVTKKGIPQKNYYIINTNKIKEDLKKYKQEQKEKQTISESDIEKEFIQPESFNQYEKNVQKYGQNVYQYGQNVYQYGQNVPITTESTQKVHKDITVSSIPVDVDTSTFFKNNDIEQKNIKNIDQEINQEKVVEEAKNQNNLASSNQTTQNFNLEKKPENAFIPTTLSSAIPPSSSSSVSFTFSATSPSSTPEIIDSPSSISKTSKRKTSKLNKLSPAISIWKQAYNELTKEPFTFTNIDAKFLKLILQQIDYNYDKWKQIVDYIKTKQRQGETISKFYPFSILFIYRNLNRLLLELNPPKKDYSEWLK